MKRTKRTKRTKTRRKTKTKTNKMKQTNQIIVQTFLQLLNMIKLYHWKTHIYAQHIATDELYTKLNEHIDKFVEILLGKNENRIYMTEHHLQLYDAANDSQIKQKIYQCRFFLEQMNDCFDKNKDSDLLSIRDDILADINQFLYLMTFR